MIIKYLGHAAFLIQNKDVKFLIDPFLSNNPQYIIDDSDIEDIDYIFVTHAHGDHIGDTEEIALRCNSTVICNAEVGFILQTKHPEMKVYRMHFSGTHTFDFGKVKMTTATHGSSIHDGKQLIFGGHPCGYLIEINNFKIYHSGDTGLLYDMKLLENKNIDLAILPIGGHYTMDIDDAVEAVELINPRKVVPIHYNTFDLIKADPNEFSTKVGKDKVIILNSGETINTDHI